MPICVAQIVQKRTVRDATVRHDGNLVSVACHRAPLAAQSLATRAWKGPQGDTLVDVLERGYRVVACRGKRLVASGNLLLTGPRRDAWHVAASSLRCLGWPSRQTPLARSLSPWLEYFVLEWLQRNHGGPWRSPGKPCRGALQLPVHKFGILGYPYSSTPTGAPGPGPHTVPSAIGLGPKQGTGTRGAWVMLNLTPYPPRPP